MHDSIQIIQWLLLHDCLPQRAYNGILLLQFLNNIDLARAHTHNLHYSNDEQ